MSIWCLGSACVVCGARVVCVWRISTHWLHCSSSCFPSKQLQTQLVAGQGLERPRQQNQAGSFEHRMRWILIPMDWVWGGLRWTGFGVGSVFCVCGGGGGGQGPGDMPEGVPLQVREGTSCWDAWRKQPAPKPTCTG